MTVKVMTKWVKCLNSEPRDSVPLSSVHEVRFRNGILRYPVP